eukprot:snap_masked-scaffold_3-processed-gene-16.31-mRNA-1 protein AED:0.45 eAED:0.46 QI:0/-1/0/1/-1/1/1/0/1461
MSKSTTNQTSGGGSIVTRSVSRRGASAPREEQTREISTLGEAVGSLLVEEANTEDPVGVTPSSNPLNNDPDERGNSSEGSISGEENPDIGGSRATVDDLEVKLCRLLGDLQQQGVLMPGPRFNEYINNKREKPNKNQINEKEKQKDIGQLSYRDKRKEESKIVDRPILESLEAQDISKFLVLFKNYEEMVIKRIVGLDEADITRSLTYKTILELQMSEVDPTNRYEVVNYLNRLNQQNWNAKKHTLLQRANRKLKWKNMGDVHSSMRKYLGEADNMVLGMDLADDKYLNKAFSLLVLKKTPLTFRGKDPQYTQKFKGWKDYVKMKKELLNLSILLSSHDYLDPQMKMEQMLEETTQDRKVEIKKETNSAPRKVAVENTRYGKRHKLPSWWSKEQKKKYGLERGLCLYCFTDNHRAADCPMLAEKGNVKKVRALPEATESRALQTKLVRELLAEYSGPVEDVAKSYDIEVETNGAGKACMVKPAQPAQGNETTMVEEEVTEAGEANDEVGEYVGNNEPGFFDNIMLSESDKEDNFKEVRRQIVKKLDQIRKKHKLSPDQLQQLTKLFNGFQDVFAVTQTGCSMSHLSPMEVYIKPGAQPFNSKSHPVTGDKKTFLEKKIQDLESIGALERDPNPYFSSPAFIVPKPQKNKFRMVIDLTRLNRNTEASAGSLPHWETQFSWLPTGCKFFGLYDALSGFDMLKITPESEKYFGISTMLGVYRLKCAPMGYHSTPFIYSERIISEVLNAERPHLFGADRAGVLQWLDDSLIYSTRWEGFIEATTRYLTRCRNRNLRLNLMKCDLLTTSPTWCGRVIASSGWTYSEKHYNKIRQIPRPLTIGHLETILYLSNWLSNTIPRYAEVREELWTILQVLTNMLTTESQRKNKKRRKEVRLEGSWSQRDQNLLQELKQLIEDSCKKQLSNYDPKTTIGLFSDASDRHWSSILVCRLVESEPWKPIFFLSGTFKNSSIRWSVTSKELYPILKTLTRFRYFLLGHPTAIKVYTDHNNLVGLFDILSPGKHSSIGRLQRWKLLIQEFNVQFEHIPGERNVVADFLSRWGYNDDTKREETPFEEDTVPIKLDGVLIKLPKEDLLNIMKRRGTAAKVLQPSTLLKEPKYKDFVQSRISFLFPDRISLNKKQKLIKTEDLLKLQKMNMNQEWEYSPEHGCYLKNGRKVVPQGWLVRLLSQLHVCGNHSSLETLKKEANMFEFEGVSTKELGEAIRLVHHFCLHCDNSSPLQRRKYSSIIHAEVPNKVLHSDYLYVINGYILVITDDLSRKVLLHYSKKADAAGVVKAIIRWKSCYGLLEEFILYSDRGAHFANKLVDQVIEELRGKHRLSIAYAPWTNSGAERTNRVILSSLRVLCSELLFDMERWGELLPLVECFMNNKIREKINLTPNEIFWGRRNKLSLLPESGGPPYRDTRDRVIIVKGKEWNAEQASSTVKNFMNRIAGELEVDHTRIFKRL